jgi:hypothetical protein
MSFYPPKPIDRYCPSKMSAYPRYRTDKCLRLSRSPLPRKVFIKEEPLLTDKPGSGRPTNTQYFPIRCEQPSGPKAINPYSPSTSSEAVPVQTRATQHDTVDSSVALDRFLQLLEHPSGVDSAPVHLYREPDRGHRNASVAPQSSISTPEQSHEQPFDKFHAFRRREYPGIQKRRPVRENHAPSRVNTHLEGQNRKLMEQNRKLRFRITELGRILNSLQGRFNGLKTHLRQGDATHESIKGHIDKVQSSLNCGTGVGAKAALEFDDSCYNPNNMYLPY